MEFPQYSYRIEDDKFEARRSLFKYMIGLYTALIAASLIGFEKAKVILDIPLDINTPSILYLRKCVVILVLSIVQSLLVLVLNYHHKHYNEVFLKKHRHRYNEMNEGQLKTVYGWYVYLEHLWARVETYALYILAATWYILPFISLYFLAKAYNGIFS